MLEASTHRTATLALLSALVIGGVGLAQADADASKRIDRFTVGVKTVSPAGEIEVIEVGEVRRTARGGIAAKGMPAPALDAMTDRLVRRWRAHAIPPKAVVTEMHRVHTGMKPPSKAYTFTFEPGDRLYQAAVVHAFVEEHGYETLGLRSITFIEHDTEPSRAGRGHIDDEARHHSNFRKGTTLDYESGGRFRIHIYETVRPANMGKPDGVFRTSASKPTLAVSQNHDAGTQLIGYLDLNADGPITVVPRYARDTFEAEFGSFGERDVGVSVIEDGKTYKDLPIAKASPLYFEAFIVENLEHRGFYIVSPTVDPAIFE